MEQTGKTGYRYNAVDIHSHILPGVDDGAEDLRESLALLEADRREGILDVIATSHYGIENGYVPETETIRAAFAAVREAAEKAGRTGRTASACIWGKRSTVPETRRSALDGGKP